MRWRKKCSTLDDGCQLLDVGCWMLVNTGVAASTGGRQRLYHPVPSICPDRSLHRTIHFSATNCAGPMTCLPMRSCSLAPRESVSVSASISCGTVFDRSGRTNEALHVPLGKLHTERLVPADDDLRQIVARILVLRALAPPARLQSPRASCRRVPGTLTPYVKLCCGHWRLPLNEQAAADR